MKEKTFKNNIAKLVGIAILILFLTTSAGSTFIKKNDSLPPAPLPREEYYEWRDDFNNSQLIDASFSSNYEVTDGVVKIKGTYSIWTDPAWIRMKPITVVNNGVTLTNYAIHFVINYDTDMQSDYGDIRFKHENTPTNFLSYWIESFDSSSVNVWVKVPSLAHGTNNMYLFYDNPAANDESNFGDTFTDWQYNWPNDEEISYHADNEGAWDPDVSYGGGNYLVAWEEGQALWFPYSWGFKQEIRASIFEPGQSEPAVFDKEIFSEKNDYTYYHNENPSIAYSGSKWFVAWEHYAPTDTPLVPADATTEDIKGRTVVRNGDQLTLGTVYDICAQPGTCQADANVVYDSVNDKFMVTWEDERDGTGDWDIWAQLVNSNTGAPIGGNIRLSNDINSQSEPWAAYDPIHEQYFVVWEDGITGPQGPFRIRGGIFDENLNNIWTGTIAEPTGYPNQDVDYNFPAVCFNSNTQRYLVTWNDDDISDGDWWGNVYGKIYDSSGNVEVDTFTINNGNFVRTDIAPYLTNAFLVSFDNNQKVFGRLISSEGELYGADIQLSGSPAAQADWASIDTDGSNVFLAWEDLRMDYPAPYDDVYPDAFGNSVHLNIPSESGVTYTFGQEEQLYLTATVTSVKIHPTNLDNWHQFLATFDPSSGNINFDIMDESGYNIILPNVSPGQSLSSINPDEHPQIRCRTTMTRTVPSYSPTLDSWSVLYEGRDMEPPVTTVKDVEGTLGNNDWYKSETVTVWLDARDYPEDTGSGINTTYYTLDGGEPQIYNVDSGILLSTYAPEYWHVWAVNFWSVDNQGNVEDHNKPENYRTIKIDPKAPQITIYDPIEEQEVKTPFWVRANVVENAEIDHVEFDIEPFGERPGLPIKDTLPPWEWYCDVEEQGGAHTTDGPFHPLSKSVQIRADVYDKAGNMGRHQIFVTIKNWGARSRVIILPDLTMILKNIKLGIIFADNLNVKILNKDNIDTAKFTVKKILTGVQSTITDTDSTDGFSASFDVSTGLYKLTATYFKEGTEIDSEILSRVLFINR